MGEVGSCGWELSSQQMSVIVFGCGEGTSGTREKAFHRQQGEGGGVLRVGLGSHQTSVIVRVW